MLWFNDKKIIKIALEIINEIRLKVFHSLPFLDSSPLFGVPPKMVRISAMWGGTPKRGDESRKGGEWGNFWTLKNCLTHLSRKRHFSIISLIDVFKECKKGALGEIGLVFLKTYKKYHYFSQFWKHFTTLNLLIKSNLHTKSWLPHVIKLINCHKILWIGKQYQKLL